LLGADTIRAAYPYLASLQVLTFFGCRSDAGPLFAGGGSVRGTVTVFPMQYIFDINAWGARRNASSPDGHGPVSGRDCSTRKDGGYEAA
jgi:hypothetical protein